MTRRWKPPSAAGRADPPPLTQTVDGAIWIADTRIPLERIIRAFQSGSTPEQIVYDFDVLRIEDVYAVINYYLHHRETVEDYLKARENRAADDRREIETFCGPTGIRKRLLAQRKTADS